MCYSSNSLFRTISDTAACILSLLCSWQGKGGAIRNNGGTANIAESEFLGNTAEVSDSVCA